MAVSGPGSYADAVTPAVCGRPPPAPWPGPLDWRCVLSRNSLVATALLAASRFLPRGTPLLGPLVRLPVTTVATGAMLAYTVIDLVRDDGGAGRSGTGASARSSAGSGPDGTWSRDDLYALARRRGIRGRSRMSKAELLAALQGD